MAEQFTFPQSGDNDDAEHFGSLIGQGNISDYVETGLDLQNYNSAGPDIDVTTGKCFILQASETASSSGDTILRTNSVVQVPSTSTLALQDSAVNEIYVDPDFGTDDNATVNATTGSLPSNSLKIGEVDTTADTVDDDFNREPKITIDTITDRNGNTVYDGSQVLAARLDTSTVVEVAGDTMTGTLNMGENNVTEVLELQFDDDSGDGGIWAVTEDSSTGNLNFVEDSTTQADIDDTGNVRISGEITENASL